MTTQVVNLPVRTNMCTATTVRGFLVLWVPLTPEVKRTNMSDLLPLRVGDMAKYECKIQYQLPLSYTISAVSEEKFGWVVAAIQKNLDDTRKANRMILRNSSNESLVEVLFKDTYLRAVRTAYFDGIFNPEMQFKVEVELESSK